MDNYYSFNGVVVRESLYEDVAKLELRKSDVDEIWASHNHRPKEALELSLKESIKCFTVEDNGEVVAMFGITAQSLLSNKGCIWLLASNNLRSRAIRFIRHSKAFIQIMLNYYPYLENYVYEENKESIDWLRRIGAKIDEPQVYGIEGKLFRHFSFSRN